MTRHASRAVAPLLASLALALLLPALPSSLAGQDNDASARAKRDQLWSRMVESVGSIVRETDAAVGVAILDLTDGRTFLLHADDVYPTASTIKIAVLGELLRQHEHDGAKLGDPYTVSAQDIVAGSDIMGGLTAGVTRITNRDLATMMVAVSDNSATNVLIDRVGMERVNAWLAGAGLKETRLRRHMMDVPAAQAGRENTATPHELVTLLAALYGGSLLSKAGTDDYFKLLATHKSAYIPRYIPADIVVATKPGDLDAVRNDAGVVFAPGRPFAIAVMTTFGRDERSSEEAIARIAQAAWGYFDRVGKSSPLGRIVR